jgi:hypothetical protein
VIAVYNELYCWTRPACGVIHNRRRHSKSWYRTYRHTMDSVFNALHQVGGPRFPLLGSASHTVSCRAGNLEELLPVASALAVLRFQPNRDNPSPNIARPNYIRQPSPEIASSPQEKPPRTPMRVSYILQDRVWRTHIMCPLTILFEL